MKWEGADLKRCSGVNLLFKYPAGMPFRNNVRFTHHEKARVSDDPGASGRMQANMHGLGH